MASEKGRGEGGVAGPAQRKVVVLIASSRFGEGEDEIGRVLMRAFVKNLKDVAPRPECAFFVNTGVLLTTEGSDLLDDLRALSDVGVEILSCGTCLDYYRLKEKLAVGEVTNMARIAATLVSADTVVRP